MLAKLLDDPENHEACRDKKQKTLEDENDALRIEIQRIKIQYELLQKHTSEQSEELKAKQISSACKDDIIQQNNKEIQVQKDSIQQREVSYAQLYNTTMENSSSISSSSSPLLAHLKDALIKQQFIPD
jgi:hypothetical protein